jgi:hypothetical protein
MLQGQNSNTMAVLSKEKKENDQLKKNIELMITQ